MKAKAGLPERVRLNEGLGVTVLTPERLSDLTAYVDSNTLADRRMNVEPKEPDSEPRDTAVRMEECYLRPIELGKVVVWVKGMATLSITEFKRKLRTEMGNRRVHVGEHEKYAFHEGKPPRVVRNRNGARPLVGVL